MGLLLLWGCLPYDSVFCAPCVAGGCGDGLSCLGGVCTPADQLDTCPEFQELCGTHPPCKEGFECFQGQCMAPVEIVSGDSHSCVRWASGRVSCWGDNRYGQVGDVQGDSTVPHTIPEIDDAVSLATTAYSSCALLADGQVLCWGRDTEGALGTLGSIGVEGHLRNEARPRPVDLPFSVVHLGGGYAHMCATTVEGDLYCWGRGGANGRGCLLGDSNAGNSPVPVLIAEDTRFEQLTGGHAHSLAVQDGQLYGWGWSDQGVLFEGTSGPEIVCTPKELSSKRVRKVSSGWFHTCFEDETNRVHCRGNDGFGQLAGGHLDFGTRLHRLVAQQNNTCAQMADGRVYCWGDPNAGILGSFRHLGAKGRPRLVAGTQGTVDLAVGSHHACVIHPQKGVLCWGSDHDGQLTGKTGAVFKPTQTLSGHFRSVSAGGRHACAITRDDQLWCWGDNLHGQLGQGFRSRSLEPVKVAGLRVLRVVASQGYTVVLTTEGEVWCFGLNSAAQCGGEGSHQLQPRRVQRLGKVLEIDAGDAHNCALEEGGSIKCWGSNELGQIDGRVNNKRRVHTNTHAPFTVQGMQGVATGPSETCTLIQRQIRCRASTTTDLAKLYPRLQNLPEETVSLEVGGGFVLALTEGGDLYSYGSNRNGRLGVGHLRDRQTTNKVSSLANIRQMSAQADYSCALDTAGRVYCWGSDFKFGRLGHGPSNDFLRPVQVPLPGPAVSVSAGRNASCVVLQEGDIMCFGRDYLGLISTQKRYSLVPEKVLGLRGGTRVSTP